MEAFGVELPSFCHFVIKLEEQSEKNGAKLLFPELFEKYSDEMCLLIATFGIYLSSSCHFVIKIEEQSGKNGAKLLFPEIFEKCSHEFRLETRLLASISLRSVISSSKSKNEASYEAKLLFIS